MSKPGYKRYFDKYCVVWLRRGDSSHVYREDDGCVGGWFNGAGLFEWTE